MDEYLYGIYPDLAEQIEKQLAAAIQMAVKTSPGLMADEDAVTGALFSNIQGSVHGEIELGRKEYRWKTRAFKLRGRGMGAPEKNTGVDGIIEIYIWDGDDNRLAMQKSVILQAKKQDSGGSAKLFEQVEKMRTLSCNGIVAEYGPDTFSGYKEDVVFKKLGRLRDVDAKDKFSLSDLLGEMFLSCKVGRKNTGYSSSTEKIIRLQDGERMSFLPIEPRNILKVQAIVRRKLRYFEPSTSLEDELDKNSASINFTEEGLLEVHNPIVKVRFRTFGAGGD